MTDDKNGDKDTPKEEARGLIAWLLSVWREGREWLKNTPAVAFAILFAVIAEIIAVVSFLFISERNSDAWRNFILAFAAILGAPFLMWRGLSLDRQSKAAAQQAATDLRWRLEDAYAKYAEMIGSRKLANRLAGLRGVGRIAKESPQVYHLQVMDLLFAFIRKPQQLDDWQTDENDSLGKRPDIATAISLIRARSEEQVALEVKEKYRLDFSDLNLAMANFRGAILKNADFTKAVLRFAHFKQADLQNADFSGAELEGAYFESFRIRECLFSCANLRGAVFQHTNCELVEFANADLRNVFFVDCDLARAKFYEAAVNGIRVFINSSTTSNSSVLSQMKEYLIKGVLLKEYAKDLPSVNHETLDISRFNLVSIDEWEEKRKSHFPF
jgi:uncharacterized protein YjbI with pentapeptide repeats